MGRSSETEQIRRRLAGAVRRKAFESYVRRGHVPEGVVHLAEIAADERKFIDFGNALSLASRPDGRPTAFYVWRTAGDERVRSSHAARATQVLPWQTLLPLVHPGTEPNCRCWPEPYYGNPAIPDALLPLTYGRDVDETGSEPWASAETLRRPDGSLAASAVTMRDGTKIRSTFSGRTVDRSVTLPTGQTVRFETRNKIQNIHIGKTPMLQSAWSPEGVVVSRPRATFRDNDNDLMPDAGSDLVDEPFDALLNPDLLSNPTSLGDFSQGLGGLGPAALALFLALERARASMGVGTTDAPVIGYKIWTNDVGAGPGSAGRPIAVPVFVDALTEEQARQTCKLLPDAQKWTDLAALMLAPERGNLSRQNFGIKLHGLVKGMVDTAKKEFPVLYQGIFAEYSIEESGELGSYGGRGTKRLDIVELIPPQDPKIVCDYEVKTGNAQLGGRQLAEYMARLVARYPGATIFMFQVIPRERPSP